MAEAEEVLNTSQELSVVCQSDIVFSHPGDEVVLSCHLEPAISAASMEIQWWHKEDPVFRYKDGWVAVNRDYEGRVSLPLENLHNGNVSLTLRDVRTSQKGLYICEVTNESQSIQDHVFLRISSVDFRLVAPSEMLSADRGSDVILPVHLSPETSAVSMEIRWFKGTELIYQYMNGQEMKNNDFENRVSLSSQELRSGKLALTLRNVQLSDSGVYTCKVFHDGCQKRGVVHLKVKDEDFRLVTPIGTVSADPGSDVILPVHLSPETSAVSMDIRWFKGTELIYQYKNRQEITNYENRMSLSIQKLERGNLALTLRNFQPSDSGDYTCKVFHDEYQQTGIVHLQVREIERCDDTGHRHLRRVLRHVKNDILLQKAQLLQGTIHLFQDTLNEDEMRNNAFGPGHRRSNSKERIPPLLEDDGMHQTHTTEADRRVFERNFDMHISSRLHSTSEPIMARHNGGQNRRQTNEGNTDTHQELLQTQNLLRNITGESTHGQKNPGTTVQSIATEPEGSSLPVQSQVQEGGRPSESVMSAGGESTRMSERPEDRRQRTRQRPQSIQNMCQIM